MLSVVAVPPETVRFGSAGRVALGGAPRGFFQIGTGGDVLNSTLHSVGCHIRTRPEIHFF